MTNRSILLDVLKGLAIIAVILYHCGLLTYGYLGVEMFLVIGGYLITKSIMRSYEKDSFSYWQYFNKRLVRLWPLVLIISAVSLLLGWLWMLPQSFKMTSESAFASAIFANNIVQCITCGNYWNASNDYYPLMHTWYVGVIFQFYVLYPLVFIFTKKFANNFQVGASKVLWTIFTISLLLYVLPIFSTAQNFYLLPSRLFEFTAGALIAISPKNYSILKNSKLIISIGCLILLLLLSINANLEIEKVRLLFTVALSTVFVVFADCKITLPSNNIFCSTALLGEASYSLYLCHQVILAFYRYTVNDIFTYKTYALMIILSLIVGFMVYFLIEKPLYKYARQNIFLTYRVNAICLIFAVLLAMPSIYYYKHQGMVRNLPEFNMYVGQNSESPFDYNSRTLRFDKDFELNGRKNVLVIGDSFGRDWMNVLLESGVNKKMNISYHINFDEVLKKRIKYADYIFVANFQPLTDKYPDLLPMTLHKKFYRVGPKSFGSCIGILYNNNRYGENYYRQTVVENRSSASINEKEKKLYGASFIDMANVLKDKDGRISVFYNRKFITEDGIHLTRSGAQLYAKRLNVWKYLK
jgi:peptidoglycan/LPS O-acetylase OafA/YrhL